MSDTQSTLPRARDDESTIRELVAALKDAISFQNEDTECLCGECECAAETEGKWAGKHTADCPAICPDHRCKDHGCMVMRVNMWRLIASRAEGRK